MSRTRRPREPSDEPPGADPGLLRLRLPRSLIYWFNPIAWLGNWTQLTAVTGGFLRGMDLAVTSIASLLGIPVIGSFLYWFVFGWVRWRRPGLVFFLLTVPCLCSMQLTTKRAYEAFAERYHAQSRTQLEAAAISKALYVIQAGGLRLFRPLKNFPIQIGTSDETWIKTVGELVRRANAIIVDLSARSASIEVEQRLIDENGARERVVVLAEERGATRVPPDEVPESAIRYSPSFMNSAVWSLVKVGGVLALWYWNLERLWGWLPLLTLPYLVMPSVSRATRKAIREAIRLRVGRA